MAPPGRSRAELRLLHGGNAVVYAPIERSMANKNPKRTVEDKNGSRGGVSGCWLGARKGRWLIGLLRLPNCCNTRDLGRSAEHSVVS